MRINILLPGFGLIPAGGFKIAYTYANYLQKRGHRVTIIHAHSMLNDDMNTLFSDYLQLLVAPPKWFHFAEGIKCLYWHHFNSCLIPDADICIATAWRTAVFANSLSCNKGKKIYLIQDYEVWGSDKKKDVDETWLYDMDKVVISKWLLSLGEKIGASKMHYIPNSINFHKYKIITPIDMRAPVIAMQYRERRSKNCQMGINVMKYVHRVNPNARIVFFGPKARDNKIPKWIEYYENPDQRFIVEKIYNESSLFVCTSDKEGFGLPPMEAMACGCTVVSTKNGGVEDFVINDKTGILCNVNDVNGMAESILHLLDDDKKRVQLAEAGYKKVHKFKWKESFEKFEKLLKE